VAREVPGTGLDSKACGLRVQWKRVWQGLPGDTCGLRITLVQLDMPRQVNAGTACVAVMQVVTYMLRCKACADSHV
jgi:hypothetical protein